MQSKSFQDEIGRIAAARHEDQQVARGHANHFSACFQFCCGCPKLISYHKHFYHFFPLKFEAGQGRWFHPVSVLFAVSLFNWCTGKNALHRWSTRLSTYLLIWVHVLFSCGCLHRYIWIISGCGIASPEAPEVAEREATMHKTLRKAIPPLPPNKIRSGLLRPATTNLESLSL